MLSLLFRAKLLRRLSLASSLVAALALSGPTAPPSPPSAGRESLTLSITAGLWHSPNFPNVETPVTGLLELKGDGLYPDRVCMGYFLKEIGDGIPLRRNPRFAPWRLSCLKPEWRTTKFEWGIMWDGTYLIEGWSERDGRIESRPLPIEMVVRP